MENNFTTIRYFNFIRTILIVVFAFLLLPNNIFAARYSVTSGDWTNTAVWSASSGGASGASAPVAGEAVFLERGCTVTIGTADAACASITFSGVGAAPTLVVDPTFTLTMTGAVTVTTLATASNLANITGGGTITGGTTVAIGTAVATTVAGTTTLNSSITQWTVSGVITLTSRYSTAFNDAVFQIPSGTVQTGTSGVGGITTANQNAGNNSTIDMTTGVHTGTLIVGGTTSNFIKSGTGTSTWNFNAVGATVEFSTSSSITLPAIVWTFYNFTYSGTGTPFYFGAADATFNGTFYGTSSCGRVFLSSAGTRTFTFNIINWQSTVGSLTLGPTTTVVNISGDLTVNAAGFGMTGGYAASGYVFATINFTGASQNVDCAWNYYINFNINNGSIVNLTNDFNISGWEQASPARNATATFTVATGGILNAGAFQMVTYTGSGATYPSGLYTTFVLSSGATLKSGNSGGIATGTSSTNLTGTVLTNTRTFNAGGNYVYNYAGGTGQITGTALPATVSGSLQIDNTSGVTLTQATSVSGTVTLTNGYLITTAANLLTVTNTAVAAITGYSSANFIKGPLSRTLLANIASDGTTYFYPVADGSGNYRPLELLNIRTGAVTPVVKVTIAENGTATADCGTLKTVNPRNWLVAVVSGNFTSTTIRLTESGLGGASLVGSSGAQAGNYTTQGGNSIGASISSNAGQVPGAGTYYAVGSSNGAAASAALSDNGTQVGAASVPAGTSNSILHQSTIAVTGNNVTFSGLTCTTAGTYAAADITNLKLYYSTSSTFSVSTSVLLSTLAAPGTAGLKTFPAFGQVIIAGNTGYLFVTADIAALATVNNTISLNALTTSNLAFSGCILPTTSGSTTAGGLQTIGTYCGTLTWIGAGAGGAGTDFNTAANWSPTTVPPNSCHDVVITTTTAATILVSANTTVNSVTITNNAVGAVTLALDAQTKNLNITNDLTANINVAGGGSTVLSLRVGNLPGGIIVGGNAYFGTNSNTASYIEFNGSGNASKTGTVTFMGDVTFGKTYYPTGANTIGLLLWDGTGTQTIYTNNTYNPRLNATCQIGSANTPTVTLSTSYSKSPTTYDAGSGLTVSTGAILDLSTRTWNQLAASGTLTVNGTLRLAGTSGGQTGSNFPLNYTTNTLNASSTVEYYGTSNQTVFAVAAAGYGHLTLTNNSTKSATAALTVVGNLTINPTATFAAGTSLTHNIGGNWVNNGAFSYTTGSTINFNTAGSKTISGSSATAFNNITVNKGTDTTNVIEANGVGALSNNGNITITNGKFTMTTGTFQFNAAPTIAATGGIHVNGATLNSGNFNYLNDGLIRVTSGTANFGTSTGNELQNRAGSLFKMQGGIVNCSGRLYNSAGTATISAGTITVSTVGHATNSIGAFHMSATTNLTITGGTVVFQNASTAGTPFDLYIISGAGTKNITGGTFQFGNASTPITQTFMVSSAVNLYDIIVSTTNSPIAKLLATITGSHNITINTNGTLNTNTYNISLGGDFSNSGIFTASTGTVTFNGGVTQNITGSTLTTFKNLTIFNTDATGVNIGTSATVNGALTLTDGYINTSSPSNMLTLANGATTTIGNAGSFINGPLAYNMAISGVPTTLNLPLGKGGDWRPEVLTPTHSAATSYTYTAELFNASAYALQWTLPGTISHVSKMHYVDINRTITGGAAAPSTDLTGATVQMYYSTTDGSDDAVTDYANLTIAKAPTAGSAWTDITGTATANGTGSITSGSFTSFSRFALANKTGGSNPLPIELLNFDVTPNNDIVDILWTTSSEKNNDYFTVEKTVDGTNFEKVAQVAGAGNSTSELNYSTKDTHPYEGVSYYRLKQTDFNGDYTYSNLVSVEFKANPEFSFDVYPNPNNGSFVNIALTANKGEEILVMVYDVTGKESYSKIIVKEDNGKEIYAIDPSQKLAAGIYMIIGTSDQNIYSKKLIVK